MRVILFLIGISTAAEGSSFYNYEIFEKIQAVCSHVSTAQPLHTGIDSPRHFVECEFVSRFPKQTGYMADSSKVESVHFQIKERKLSAECLRSFACIVSRDAAVRGMKFTAECPLNLRDVIFWNTDANDRLTRCISQQHNLDRGIDYDDEDLQIRSFHVYADEPLYENAGSKENPSPAGGDSDWCMYSDKKQVMEWSEFITQDPFGLKNPSNNCEFNKPVCIDREAHCFLQGKRGETGIYCSTINGSCPRRARHCARDSCIVDNTQQPPSYRPLHDSSKGTR